MAVNHPENPLRSDSDPDRPIRTLSTRIFLGVLVAISGLYAVILAYHIARPPEAVADGNGLLEQCRQICLKYGLVTTGHVRNDAEAYLQAAQTQKLTEDLSGILNASDVQDVDAQPHALLLQSAPDFELPDDQSVARRLRVPGHDKPVVLVFYLGYECSHCVAQLLALEKDLRYFRELGAEIVAVSADSPQHTRERFREYGAFNFPVLSDADHAVAQTWGVYQPETADQREFMSHGTFVVDRGGKVIWSFLGKEPFLDNATLLRVIARSQGVAPRESP